MNGFGPDMAAFAAARLAGLQLRAMDDGDRDFVIDLYVAARAGEFAATGWPEPLLRQFLAQQHDLQDRQYRSAYADAERLIVEHDGERIGRLYVDETEQDLHLIDIAFLPAARGRGFGTALLGDLIASAAAAGKPIRLYVEKNNPARNLYRRVGFTLHSEGGVHDELRCCPQLGSSGKLLKTFVQMAG